MRKFIQKALERLDRLDHEQVAHLIAGLSEENELFAGVLESMTDGIVVTDTGRRVILSNRAAARMLGLAAEDVQDRTLCEVVADRELADFLDAHLAGTEKVADREFALDGGRRLLSVSILPLVREGRVQGGLVHVEDITERRSREARLRRAESLASLTTLAAGVAHEIKNPLGSMGIHLQLIRRKIGGKECVDSRDVEPHLAVIAEEVDRLNRIVVDFLFAVKPMDTRLEDADLNAVVSDLIAFVRPELDQAGVAVESDLAVDLPALKLDVRFVKQALLNLIKNAMAAMSGGGRLGIETRRNGDEVQVRVTDTGTGIPAEIMEKIFEPYFTTKPFGTGLGLTIVFKIVKEHFGDIAVASREGEGTTFTITLPVPQKDTMLLEDRRGAR
ncbi:MAG: ATP-binding protein [Spirochaetes bacterium]|nr:ATP-binding protein [Spirochaetota bacterium]